MKTRITNFIILTAIFLISCGGNPNEKIKKEVINLHDSAMMLMGELKKNSESFKMAVDSLNYSDSVLHKEVIAKYNEMYLQCAEAQKVMMDWMHQFDEPVDAGDDVIKAYLTDQKNKISDVFNKMQTTIQKSRKMLSNE